MAGQDKDFDFGRSLLAALEEVLAFERGELQLRTRTVEIPDPEVQVLAPPAYDGTHTSGAR